VKPTLPKEKLVIETIEEEEFEEEFEEELEEEPEEPVVEKAPPPPPPPPPPPIEAAPEIAVTSPEVKPTLKLEIPKEKQVIEKIEEESEEPVVEKPSLPPPPPPPPPVPSLPRIETAPPPVKTVVHPPTEGPLEAEEDKDTITIAGCKIKIEIPPHIMEQSRSANTEQRRKIAGVLAAQTLEKNPQLTASHTVDPVSVWSDILNVIIKKFG
jgi:hypothetical protein